MGVIRLAGTMTCPPERRDAVRAALPAHIALTRDEPGCLSFEVQETAPGLFTVTEAFRDRAAFGAHRMRAAASDWGHRTEGLPRDYTVTEE